MSQTGQSDFPGIPQFPDTVPTAPLLRISLSKLLHGDAAEEEQLWKACCDLGFFYLDLRPESRNGTLNGSNGHANGHVGTTNVTNGTSKIRLDSNAVDGNSLLRDADDLFAVGKKLFELPVEEKQKYDFADKGSYFGQVNVMKDKAHPLTKGLTGIKATVPL
jgi:hypothetical protein